MDLGFDVVALGKTEHPTVGDRAIDFVRPLVNSEYWEDVALFDLLESGPVLLVFYPMDGDFPATYIWNEIRERGWADTDTTVVGLSISTPYEHMSFIKDREINHSLFSDPQNSVAEAYDIVHDLDGMAGITEPRPAVFLIDEEQYVEYAWVAEQWPAFPDYDAIERRLTEA